MKKVYEVLGLMSGSSLDGLDIAHCKFEYEDGKILSWDIVNATTYAYNQKWIDRLKMLPEQSALVYAKTHTYLGHYMGELVNQFMEEYSPNVDFIASHGHTIFHYPNQTMTAQIGDGAALAMKTGLPVIADFRTSDIALQGEGTPLAPVADYHLFSEYNLLLNLGGIANLTYQTSTKKIAYDITPFNQILNALANEIGLPYDPDGQLAAKGKLIPNLEQRLHQFPYYKAPLPKSLDNGHIMRSFLPKVLESDASIEDKLHTCCHVFAQQIANNIASLQELKNQKILVTGGGSYNDFFISCLQQKLNTYTITLPNPTIIDYKEALLMALLGVLRVERQHNCFSEITYAKHNTINGAIYQGWKKFI